MPRNTRNFWIEAFIDGRARSLSGGPQAKDGGLEIDVWMRHQGSPFVALQVRGYALADGSLILQLQAISPDLKDVGALAVESQR